MKRRIRASVLIAAGVGIIPVAMAADRYDQLEKQDMRQAIAFERHKEEAAARQARIERRRGSEQAQANRQTKASADRAAPKAAGDAGAKARKQAPR